MLVVHETPLEFDLTKHLFSFLLEITTPALPILA